MKRFRLRVWPACLVLLSLMVGCASQAESKRVVIQPAVVAPGGIMQTDYAPQIAETLKAAGDNAGELRKFLDHYAATGDAQKAKAAEFLVANMSPHGYVEAGLFDANGTLVPFDALDYDNFDEALAGLDKLEAEHKGLHTKRKRALADMKCLSAAYLIRQTDEAFDAWRTLPWSSPVTFDTFCNYILPYRGSNEPADLWRKPCRDALLEELQAVTDPNDLQAVSHICSKHRGQWVKFRKKCYLHPTDQGYEDMRRTGVGRCEDLANMQTYLNRANGVPIAGDYTPAWARGNNNHAWTAALDAHGKAYPRGKPMLNAAKVYRKMFAMQPELPMFHRADGEQIPGWLAGECYRDVTREYRPTHDLAVPLTRAPGPKSTWAYLCVFNSGRWVPIAAGRIDRDANTAAFAAMGGNIAYLPAYYADKKLIPVGPVTLLETDGTVRRLDAPIRDKAGRVATAIRRMKDVDISPDTGKPIPAIKVQPGNKYELFYWDGKWVSLGKKTAPADESLAFDNLPAGRFYRLVEVKGRNQERPFTLDDGKQVLW